MKTFSAKKAISFGWQTTLQNKRFLIGIVLLTTVIHGVYNSTADAISGQFNPRNYILESFFNLVGYVLDAFITLGLIRIALNFVDHHRAKLADLFWVFGRPGKLVSYFGALLIYVGLLLIGIIPLAGLTIFLTLSSSTQIDFTSNGQLIWAILVVIPFVVAATYLAVKYVFFSYAITDRHTSALLSLRHSAEITSGVKMRLVGFGLLVILINLIWVSGVVVVLFAGMQLQINNLVTAVIGIAGLAVLVIGAALTIPTAMVAAAHVYRQLSPKN